MAKSKNIVIRDDASARAYLASVGRLDGLTIRGGFVRFGCGRCGGRGHLGRGKIDVPFGTCFRCGGVGITEVGIMRYARGVKRDVNRAKPENMAKRRAAAEAREARDLAAACERYRVGTWERAIDSAIDVAALRTIEDAPGKPGEIARDMLFRLTWEGRALSQAAREFAARLVSEGFAAAGRVNGWRGEVGERIEFDAEVVRRVRLYVDDYGNAHDLWILRDDEGRTLVWKTSGFGPQIVRADGYETTAGEGDRVRLRGTVKAHGTREGVKQTELARVTVPKGTKAA